MYTYNRKYIEQQIIGPSLVLNTVIFLFVTILMITISQNSIHVSDKVHNTSNSSWFLSWIFEKNDSEPLSVLFDANMISEPYCRSLENTVLSTVIPSYGMCQVYLRNDTKQTVNVAISMLGPDNLQLLYDRNDPYAFHNHLCFLSGMDIFNYQSQPFTGIITQRKLSPYEKKAKPFHPIIYQVAERYEVEPAIIKAIIMAESSFNPKAVSHKGAQGLMQLMPRTAKYMGVKDSFNPEHNIDGGVKYFKILLDRFNGDVRLALAAYNAGSRNVRKYNGVPPFKATKLYIKKVLQYYEEYKTT